jgi:hypothetical protein
MARQRRGDAGDEHVAQVSGADNNVILSARPCVFEGSYFRLLEEEDQGSVWTMQKIP